LYTGTPYPLGQDRITGEVLETGFYCQLHELPRRLQWHNGTQIERDEIRLLDKQRIKMNGPCGNSSILLSGNACHSYRIDLRFLQKKDLYKRQIMNKIYIRNIFLAVVLLLLLVLVFISRAVRHSESGEFFWLSARQADHQDRAFSDRENLVLALE